MPLYEAFKLAVQSILSAKLRSFFTLLGIIVSVGFLVTVVAVIQGMNSYVKENITGAVIGTNAFQVRRTPIAVGLLTDDELREIAKRPRLSREDAAVVHRAIPDAQAVSLQSGWPTPTTDVTYRNRTVGDVLIFGVTPPYQVVQDYRFVAGEPLADPDVRERRYVVVLGYDVADKLFGGADQAIGRRIRLAGREMTVKAVTAKKGRVLGQSFDGFVLVPLPNFEMVFGRRKTNNVSVKMPSADLVPSGMERANEAMRVAHHLRPADAPDYSVETADALVEFWKNLTRILFSVIPAIVAIGVVVGGIVIMNIMLMSVTERTHEIGVRKAMGARRGDIQRQFLVEAIVLASIGGLFGVVAGWGLAGLVSLASPLPARVSVWSVILALSLGAGVGVLFGVYPASRAAQLDPID
ncbi:MAG TPA: ABC transporter permease, partial [Gemmatimonadales bacterium]|nr:ABC transporter permease [Gemmatimonadales bacterium]